MRKFVCGISLLGSLLLASCGSSSPTNVVSNEVPASICLTTASSCSAGQSSTSASVEVGKTQQFVAQAFNSAGTAETEAFIFQSSNPSALTVANNGQACAGTWDSVTAPTVCTPGTIGVAKVTAQANGVTSPAMDVYVHPHVTNIVISKVPGQPPTLSPLCLTRAAPLLGPGPESVMYQASAYAGPAGSNDITSTVGPFTWQSVALPGQTAGTSTAVTLGSGPVNSPQCLQGINGQCFNLEVATAGVPGATAIVASAGGVNSPAVPFLTCPVQSIQVTPANNSPNTTFAVTTGTTTDLNATVKDTLNLTLTGVPLTWSASTPTSVSVAGATSNVYGSVGTVSSPAIGGGSVTASCTPPTCNGGMVPSNPIYSPQAFGFTVTPTTTAPPSPTAYATTSACTTTSQGCTARIVPLTETGTAAQFTAGGPVNLPFAPNSVQFDSQGSSAYLGVNSASFGTQGLMVFSGSSVSQATGVAGKVLAISPLASSSATAATVILSDTVDSPSRVFVCLECSNSSSRTVVPFLLPNAISAAFSPDGLKAYIVSAGSCPGTSSAACLLIYSTVDGPQFVQLNTPPTDVAFIGQGGFGYLGGSASTSFLATCDHPAAFPAGQSFGLPSLLLRPLPDGQSLAALAPPNIQTMTATVSGSGCVSPRGSLGVTNTVGAPVNLGVGNFAPKQFLISPDGAAAYILGQVQQAVNFPVTAATCILNSAGTGCASPITYTYTWTSGPAVALGADITLAGLPTADNGTFRVVGVSGPAPNGSGGFSATFTVANSSAVPASGLSGTASGTETLNLDFVLVYHLQSQTSSEIALVGSATPLSASVSSNGDLLFVGADDNQVHVINTATQVDTEQVPLTFPQNSSLCVGPGSPPTALESLLTITTTNQDPATGTTTFAYALNSGPPVAVGNAVKVAGMADPGNNGTFVVSSVSTGSFVAVNPIGVTATSQNGSGSAGLACNPDLVFVKP